MSTSGGENGGAPRRREGLLTVFTHLQWEQLAAGLSGGVLSTLVLHPLDLVKVRFQGDPPSCNIIESSTLCIFNALSYNITLIFYINFLLLLFLLLDNIDILWTEFMSIFVQCFIGDVSKFDSSERH